MKIDAKVAHSFADNILPYRARIAATEVQNHEIPPDTPSMRCKLLENEPQFFGVSEDIFVRQVQRDGLPQCHFL